MLGEDNVDNEPLLKPAEATAAPKLDLFTASQQGNSDLVKQFIDTTNSPDDTDCQNVTALHWASINNHINVVQLLLDRGASIDKRGGK